MPKKIAEKEVTIGTKREPPKNPRNCGNSILRKRLCSTYVIMPAATPPKTPVSSVWIPNAIPCPAPTRLSFASVPVIFSIALMVEFITSNDKTADNPAVPLSDLATPTAMPTANKMAKLAKITFPAAAITANIFCSHAISRKGYALMESGFDKAPPIPNKIPAAGNTAMGSIKDLPKLCALANRTLSLLCFCVNICIKYSLFYYSLCANFAVISCGLVIADPTIGA